ncbi:MAG: Holliday junction branch migration protein RuvA [Sandaracinaceae bacterium]|nr:Holliday junction branch migration protein RuvA [Sandaracinaceae bacterium]
MIGRLRGTIAERLPDGSCIVDVAGVGYEVFVPLGTLGRLPDAPEVVTLHVHTHVREDQLALFGFARAEDKRAFRTLLGVSSIGPKLALAILGSMDARQLAAAIATEDKARFKGIPGVGKRTVERLLLELRDKLGFAAATAMVAAAAPRANGTPASDAAPGSLGAVREALVALGFKPVEADAAIAAIAPEATADEPFESLVKRALAHTL